MKYFIFFALLFSTPIFASDFITSNYNCTHKDTNLVRQVKIIHKEQGCQVSYVKSFGTANEISKVLWSANNSTEYCDVKGHAFVEEKLQKKYGWVCIDEMNK